MVAPSTRPEARGLGGFVIAIPNTCILPRGRSVGRRGGPPPPPNPPRTAATGQVFKIIFQDFGKIILKNNLEKKSRLFFKILAKIFLNKIIDFTT